MRLRVPLALLATALLGSGFVVEAGPGALDDTQPAVRIAALSPLILTAAGFAPGERVRLVVRSSGTATRWSVAGARGGFRATISRLRLHRCDSVFVRAEGSQGNRASTAKLAKPGCLLVRTSRRPAIVP